MSNNIDATKATILAAVQYLAWLLRFPQDPASYPEVVATHMTDEAQTLAPLAPKDIDRATSWLIHRLWEKVSRGAGEEEKAVVLYQTDDARRPDALLRLMGEEIGLDAEQLALRIPKHLCAWIALSGEALVTIGHGRYVQVLSPTLALDPGVALVCFEVPISEQHRSVLRELGVTFSSDGRFVTLTSEEQRMRMALASTSSALATLLDWEPFFPPEQGGTSTGAHLYRFLNFAGGGWQPWLVWASAMRSTDFPPEEPWSDRVSRKRRLSEQGLSRSLLSAELDERLFADRERGEESHRQPQEEESGPFGRYRQMLITRLATVAYQRDSDAGYRTIVRRLEKEGALLRWERVQQALRSSIGEREAETLQLDKPSGIAMLAAALTGKNELVLQDAGATVPLRPNMPAQMVWVWGIPITDLKTAARVSAFMKSARTFKLQDRYEIAFVQPNGQASPCPILYGITTAEQAGDQCNWLASGDGKIPL
jgi:hypothetical protein